MLQDESMNAKPNFKKLLLLINVAKILFLVQESVNRQLKV